MCPEPAGGPPKENSEKQLTAFRNRRGRMQWMHVFLHSHGWIDRSKSEAQNPDSTVITTMVLRANGENSPRCGKPLSAGKWI